MLILCRYELRFCGDVYEISALLLLYASSPCFWFLTFRRENSAAITSTVNFSKQELFLGIYTLEDKTTGFSRNVGK
jgi:hypothetical protein